MPPRRSTARRGRAAQSAESPESPPKVEEPEPAPAPRRGRGRPRKHPLPEPKPKSEPEPKPEPEPELKTEEKAEPKPDPNERVHALPTRHNPRLEEAKSHQVKLQVIRREDKEIIIGRIKLPTVNGAEHGFLLKRFDTNAIAGSSMFRLAFPYADAESERAEMAYLETRFDTDVANGGLIQPPRNARSRAKKEAVLPPGSTGVRLQGVWIPCEAAAPIAQDYGLLEIVQPLLDATAVKVPGEAAPVLNPDPETIARAAQATESEAPSTPTRASKRVRMRQAEEESTPRRATRRQTRQTEVQSVLSPAQVDAQIREAQSLVREIAAQKEAEHEEAPEDSASHEDASAEDATVEQEADAPSAEGEAVAEDDAGEGASEGASSQDTTPSRARARGRPRARTSRVSSGGSRKRRLPEDDDEGEGQETETTKPADAADTFSSALSSPTSPVAGTSQAVMVRQPQHRRIRRAASVLAAGAVGAAALYAGNNLGISAAVTQLQQLDYSSALQVIQQNVASWNVAAWLL
ncbi:hypothetical protein MCUN1_000222 [Malassezia cuniculi]|uniref:HTH APSES-type domain-containing protein n=1 Tax=Malassezia cuniculi TaxID=948313 RepID=A0AAF0EQK4_9BASI|nr:hypothetical protein MCUN1_000222 [Malassezia cuniculi]